MALAPPPLENPLHTPPPVIAPLTEDASMLPTTVWVAWFTQVADKLTELEQRIAALEPP